MKKLNHAIGIGLTLTVAFGVAGIEQAFGVAQAGAVIIRDEPDYWGFIYPELDTMNADVVKFHLTYDNEWSGGYPAHFVVPSIHVQGAIWAGAKDIIFRSAETHISSGEISHLVNGMTFWDTGETLLDFIYNHRHEVHCWIEIGNEPDLHGADPWVHRWHLIDVANNVIPNYSWLWTMHWIASAPAYLGTYTDVFYHVNHEGSVQDKYEAIGTHEYGDYSLNMNVTNHALSKIPSSSVIWITEAGINHSYDWNTKGIMYRDAVRASPAKVRGWTFFLLSKEVYWNTCPNSDGSCLRYGIDLYYNTTNVVPGRPCATAIAGR